jgi:hypothetical protein
MQRVCGGDPRHATSTSTAAISAAGMDVFVPERPGGRIVVWDVGSDGLEHYVEIAFGTKPSAPRSNVDLMGAEVMKHDRSAVEEWLDVNELPRPFGFVEHVAHLVETVLPRLGRAPFFGQIDSPGQADHVGTLEGWRIVARFIVHGFGERARLGTEAVCAARLEESDQNFPELNTTRRTDNDDLAALECRVAVGQLRKPADVPHESVANQVRVHTPYPCPSAAILGGPAIRWNDSPLTGRS